MVMDKIYPNNVMLKYDYLKIDNMYISNIIISNLPKEINMLELNNIIPSDVENTMTMYIKKVDIAGKVKELTKIITETNSEIKSVNANQQDIDILRNINKEAVELRKKIQVENEEIYIINMYISLKDISLTNLKIKLNRIISNLYAIGVLAKVANFRQDLIYINTLPINSGQNNLANKQTGIDVTSSQLAYLMPYINNNIYTKNGIVYGFMQNSVCIYDIFEKGNMNHNLCVLGSSGAGKSYFLKTIILRNYCMNINQFILDIEGEYVKIAENINATIFNDSNFNLLYIPEIFVLNYKENYIEKKIEKVIKYLKIITNNKIDEYENICKKQIEKLYKDFSITKNLNSLYKYYNKSNITINKEYLEYSKFPSFADLVNKLEETKEIPIDVIKEMKEQVMYISYNVEDAKKLDNRIKKLVVFDLNKLSINDINIFFEYIEEFYGEKLLIYIDELWKIITKYKESNIIYKIAELFKSIRKKHAGIVVISQDIHDILNYSDGEFGKSILNNSFTKLFFKMQYVDMNSLNDLGMLSDEDINNIRKLTRGQAYMNIGDTKFNINIKASDYENKIIQGDEISEKDISSIG